jgi:hypothetical protein
MRSRKILIDGLLALALAVSAGKARAQNTGLMNGNGCNTGTFFGDCPPASPNSMDDECNGDLWDSTTRWTAVNSASTPTLSHGKCIWTASANNGARWKHWCQSLPAGTSAFMAKVWVGNRWEYGNAGISLRESGTSKFVNMGYVNSDASFATGTHMAWLSIDRWTNNTTFSATEYHKLGMAIGWVYLYVKYDQTNMFFSISQDGENNLGLYQEAKAAFLTTAPDQVCMSLNDDAGNTGAVNNMQIDWFRRVQ